MQVLLSMLHLFSVSVTFVVESTKIIIYILNCLSYLRVQDRSILACTVRSVTLMFIMFTLILFINWNTDEQNIELFLLICIHFSLRHPSRHQWWTYDNRQAPEKRQTRWCHHRHNPSEGCLSNSTKRSEFLSEDGSECIGCCGEHEQFCVPLLWGESHIQ